MEKNIKLYVTLQSRQNRTMSVQRFLKFGKHHKQIKAIGSI